MLRFIIWGEKDEKDACENQHLGNASVDIRKKRDDALATYSVQDVNPFFNENFKFMYHENNPSGL